MNLLILKHLKSNLLEGIKSLRYDWYILVGLLILSMVGVGLADATMERISHWYWLAMTPIFFAACLYTERQASGINTDSAKTIVVKQILHWLGLLVGVQLTYVLRDIGSLDNQSTALVLLLLFALATYLAGVTMGWLFRLLGIFLACSLILTAYVEHYVWILIALSIGILFVYHFLARYFGSDK